MNPDLRIIIIGRGRRSNESGEKILHPAGFGQYFGGSRLGELGAQVPDSSHTPRSSRAVTGDTVQVLIQGWRGDAQAAHVA